MTIFEKFKAMTIEDLAEALFDNDITMANVCESQVNAEYVRTALKMQRTERLIQRYVSVVSSNT